MIQHMRDDGKLTNTPRDIGALMTEVKEDVKKEEEAYIKDKLFAWAWPHLQRKITGGLPEFYKELLAEESLSKEE